MHILSPVHASFDTAAIGQGPPSEYSRAVAVLDVYKTELSDGPAGATTFADLNTLGRCKQAQDFIAPRLAAAGIHVHPIAVHGIVPVCLHQHFAIAARLDGDWYMIDPTYGQFKPKTATFKGASTFTQLSASPEGALMATELSAGGLSRLTAERAGLYLASFYPPQDVELANFSPAQALSFLTGGQGDRKPDRTFDRK